MNIRIWNRTRELGKSIQRLVDMSLKSAVVVLDRGDILVLASSKWVFPQPYKGLDDVQCARLAVSIPAIERFASESAALRGKQ